MAGWRIPPLGLPDVWVWSQLKGVSKAVWQVNFPKCEGMEVAFNSLDLLIFPKPADKHAVIANPMANALPCSILIHDALGHALYTGSLESNTLHRFMLNTRHWPSGIYFLEVEMENQHLARKFLIQQ